MLGGMKGFIDLILVCMCRLQRVRSRGRQSGGEHAREAARSARPRYRESKWDSSGENAWSAPGRGDAGVCRVCQVCKRGTNRCGWSGSTSSRRGMQPYELGPATQRTPAPGTRTVRRHPSGPAAPVAVVAVVVVVHRPQRLAVDCCRASGAPSDSGAATSCPPRRARDHQAKRQRQLRGSLRQLLGRPARVLRQCTSLPDRLA